MFIMFFFLLPSQQVSFIVSFGMLGTDGASVTLEFGFVERKLLTVIKFVPLIFLHLTFAKDHFISWYDLFNFMVSCILVKQGCFSIFFDAEMLND